MRMLPTTRWSGPTKCSALCARVSDSSRATPPPRTPSASPTGACGPGAFAVRRLQGIIDLDDGERVDGRDGVAVFMRYTLRALTTQQFERAAALVCSCEMIRRADPERWGAIPFRLGMWVGAALAPNRRS